MSYTSIQIFAIILLTAFAIERFSKALQIPSVIVMIMAGLASKHLLAQWGVSFEGMAELVPIIGTFGLILIVLEGALDIELRPNRMRLAGTAISVAVAGFFLCGAVFAALAFLVLPLSLVQAATLAVPFAVISSAVAIPSSHFLPAHDREFIVYESSLSDILGVLVFFALLNSDGTLGGTMSSLVGGGVLSLILSAVCSVGLVLVLMRIDGHIRFIPILAGLFFLYAIGKMLHLSPLLLVLFFGLVLNNPTLITRSGPFRGWMDETYEATLNEFKVLVRELTFAVRGFFFILLGYWTDLSDLASPNAWIAAAIILVILYAGRFALLKISRHEIASALTWIAPRGLITVLLFSLAKEALPLPNYLAGTVVIVILISAAAVSIAARRVREASGSPELMTEQVQSTDSSLS